jgi:hypothetical protein
MITEDVNTDYTHLVMSQDGERYNIWKVNVTDAMPVLLLC